MYITNRPDVAKIAESAGVDRIFVDMEYIGKSERQGGMDTVQNYHTISDIKTIKNAVTSAKVMVRINPIHEKTDEFCSSEDEINAVIEAGADIIMLPFFKTAEEVEKCIAFVGGRASVMPLVETPEAVAVIDRIIDLQGIDEIFVGLNDLSLGYGKKFMFELLTDGTVERLCEKFKQKGIPYGFGGIASLGKGLLPSEYIIREHYRLGSTCVILGRSFCDLTKTDNPEEVQYAFVNGLKGIRELEAECAVENDVYFEENRKEVERRVKLVCGE